MRCKIIIAVCSLKIDLWNKSEYILAANMRELELELLSMC